MEEQIQKIEAGEPIEEEEEELEDIDQLRDDLQSTKQLLEIEVRDKGNLVLENRNMKVRTGAFSPQKRNNAVRHILLF